MVRIVGGIMMHDKPMLLVRRIRRYPDGFPVEQLILQRSRFDRVVIPDELASVVKMLGVKFGFPPVRSRGFSTLISLELADHIRAGVETWRVANEDLTALHARGPFMRDREELVEDAMRRMDRTINTLKSLLDRDRASLKW